MSYYVALSPIVNRKPVDAASGRVSLHCVTHPLTRTGKARWGGVSHLRDATIFSDLIGKLDVLHVACEKCGRDGGYRLNGLIEKRGRDAKLIDWLGELTAECPKKIAHNMNDPCGAKCPQLPKVM